MRQKDLARRYTLCGAPAQGVKAGAIGYLTDCIDGFIVIQEAHR
jgi:hypothetical protein